MKVNKLINALANSGNNESFSNKLRRKRFLLFKDLCTSLPKPVRILDIGGTMGYWEKMNFTNEPGIYITILNLEKENIPYQNFLPISGDARDLSRFRDNEFDIAFSNSVIEHVGTLEDQKKMANEMMRVGKMFYLQTPNYYFPIEPHFYFPFFQIMPVAVRVFLTMHLRLGWSNSKVTDKEAAVELVRSVRLLKKKELLILFPNGTLKKEKFFGFNKSLIIYRKL